MGNVNEARRIRPVFPLGLALAAGLAVATPPLPAFAADLAVDNWPVEKVVMLSRHGVRPPTNSAKFAPLSAAPWPTWPVPDGNLTPHGREAAVLMGEYYRQRYVSAGTLPAQGCPAAGTLFVWADIDQRTRATGDALLAGLAPGCDRTAEFRTGNGDDPLFDPIGAGIAPLDPAVARQDMLSAMGGSVEAAQERWRPQLTALGKILGCCSQALCREQVGRPDCAFEDLPWAIEVKQNGRKAGLSGPLDDASGITEVFRLEYDEGFPPDQVAWGRASTPAAIKDLLVLHKAYYDVVKRVPYIARRGASQMLNQIRIALAQGTPAQGEGAAPDAAGPPPAAMTVFVGHDGNIAQLGALLGLRWSLAGSPENDTPPAGAMVFERLRNPADGSRYVRVFFMAQSMDQVRSLTPLTGLGASGPLVASVPVPGCVQEPGAEALCTLAGFETLSADRIDRSATTTPDYGPEDHRLGPTGAPEPR